MEQLQQSHPEALNYLSSNHAHITHEVRLAAKFTTAFKVGLGFPLGALMAIPVALVVIFIILMLADPMALLGLRLPR